jgi:hypothetical protein
VRQGREPISRVLYPNSWSVIVVIHTLLGNTPNRAAATS